MKLAIAIPSRLSQQRINHGNLVLSIAKQRNLRYWILIHGDLE